MKLKRNFYNQKTLKVAKELLGCFLIHKIGSKVIKARIIETEAYLGIKDKASHAHKGRTKRTELMFGLSGHAYIYLIYGMYYCFNIVTEKEDYPAAVLIRGVEIDSPAERDSKKIIGPGKVCREMKIDKMLNNEDIVVSKKLWIEKGINPSKIKKAPRIGIDYAKEYKDKLWRFIA